jgi:tetratricopeptide (TPR) repeat protein
VLYVGQVLDMRLLAAILFLAGTMAGQELEDARDQQDRAALEKQIASLRAAAEKEPSSASAHYKLALAQSYLSEVALELRDRSQAKTSAEAGLHAARRAVELKPDDAEHHRILGTLCGQVIPANVLAGLRYGRCALDSIKQALEINPKSSNAWLSRGVGNYYLPESFGGGVNLAIEDFRKAIQLNPKSADAHLWLGIALRKAGHNSEARKALERSVELNPRRNWTRQQLEKTPAR